MNRIRTILSRISFLAVLFLSAATCGAAQETAAETGQAALNFSTYARKFSAERFTAKRRESFFLHNLSSQSEENRNPAATLCDKRRAGGFAPTGECWLKEAPAADQSAAPATEDDDGSGKSGLIRNQKFKLKSALLQTGLMLSVQHSFRMLEKKTRDELGGPFFKDWAESVKGLRGWRDGDNAFTNYAMHPLQGGVTGRIYLTNNPQARELEFGKSAKYWKSRFDAMLWSAFWSTQFELGPVSEASIGNVGMTRKNGHSTMAFVDLVMTPTAGTGIVIGEDMLEKYVIKKWIAKNGGKANRKIKFWRSVMTPTMSVNNLLRGRAPWRRDD